MIFPYVMEGENSFYFNHYTSYSNSDQGCHSRGNSDGPRGKYYYIFTLKCDSSNSRYDFGTWGSKFSLQYREFNFLYCLGTFFTFEKTMRDFDIRVRVFFHEI